MKQVALIFMLLLAGQGLFAQNRYVIYELPQDQIPATTTALGSEPQFAFLRNAKTNEEVYSLLKEKSNDPAYSTELNNLFTAMGYTGVNDPAFGPEDIEQTAVPYGTIGMMGNERNEYKYTMIALPKQSKVNAWAVNSASDDNRDLVFFAACGNAFYHSKPETKTVTVVQEKFIKDYSGHANVKVKVYARNKSTERCAWCKDCDLTSGETVLLSEEDIAQIPVARDGANAPVKNIYIDVDDKTYKKIKAKEENGEYKLKVEEESLTMN